MEPAKAKVVLVFKARVREVTEKFTDAYTGGFGKEATFQRVSLGWYVLYEGSWEFLYAGHTAPPFKAGDLVRITQEKVDA